MIELNEQKIIELFKRAVKLIEEAIQAYKEMDNNKYGLNLWEVASEVEHLVFLMSLKRKSRDFWTREFDKISKLNTVELLLVVQNLLKEATELFKSDKNNAYQKTWIARRYILKIQENLDKSKSK